MTKKTKYSPLPSAESREAQAPRANSSSNVSNLESFAHEINLAVETLVHSHVDNKIRHAQDFVDHTIPAMLDYLAQRDIERIEGLSSTKVRDSGTDPTSRELKGLMQDLRELQEIIQKTPSYEELKPLLINKVNKINASISQIALRDMVDSVYPNSEKKTGDVSDQLVMDARDDNVWGRVRNREGSGLDESDSLLRKNDIPKIHPPTFYSKEAVTTKISSMDETKEFIPVENGMSNSASSPSPSSSLSSSSSSSGLSREASSGYKSGNSASPSSILSPAPIGRNFADIKEEDLDSPSSMAKATDFAARVGSAFFSVGVAAAGTVSAPITGGVSLIAASALLGYGLYAKGSAMQDAARDAKEFSLLVEYQMLRNKTVEHVNTLKEFAPFAAEKYFASEHGHIVSEGDIKDRISSQKALDARVAAAGVGATKAILTAAMHAAPAATTAGIGVVIPLMHKLGMKELEDQQKELQSIVRADIADMRTQTPPYEDLEDLERLVKEQEKRLAVASTISENSAEITENNFSQKFTHAAESHDLYENLDKEIQREPASRILNCMKNGLRSFNPEVGTTNPKRYFETLQKTMNDLGVTEADYSEMPERFTDQVTRPSSADSSRSGQEPKGFLAKIKRTLTPSPKEEKKNFAEQITSERSTSGSSLSKE
ncbi:MAG: hypothetical protein RLZZ59_438 [Pseudomonadota bacterium]|jgi:hypothetical protein